MRNALIARHSDFEIDPRRAFYPQFHRMNLNVLIFRPDGSIKSRAALTGHSRSASAELRDRSVTAQERSCRCKDLSLQCREGILPHRYIFRANTDSPPDA